MPRPPFRKPKRDPVFLGQPSPALSKIARMNIARLEEYLAKMTQEAARLQERIDELAAKPEPAEDKIASLREQRERIIALTQHASDRLREKHQRKQEWETKQASGGGAPPGGSSRFTRAPRPFNPGPPRSPGNPGGPSSGAPPRSPGGNPPPNPGQSGPLGPRTNFGGPRPGSHRPPR